MFCIKCGKTLDPSAEVCPNCGTKVVIPDGFEPHAEKNIQSDIEMLDGEKTVAADYSAIARKAVAAVNANTSAEATAAESVPAVSHVMQDTVPHSPAGFDLKSVKKTMNGRSILIDDSPLPGIVPAYLAPPVQAAPPVMPQAQHTSAAPVPEKPQNKKVLILIIVAAVLGVALVAGVLFFVLNEKNKNEDDRESSTKVTVTEERTENKFEKLDKDDFISDETANGTLVDHYTDIFIDEGADTGREELTETVTVNRYPDTGPAVPIPPVRPNDFIIEGKTEQDLSDILYNEPETTENADNGNYVVNGQEETTVNKDGNDNEKDEEKTIVSESSTGAENAR